MPLKLSFRFSCITAALALLISYPLAGQSLRDLAEQRGIRIGAAVAPGRLGEETYAATLAREFNQVQPENVTKFGLIHPARDSYNFVPADALAAFAREHHMAMRGHTLLWHRQTPPWLTQGNFKPEELSAILQEHIKTVVGHFAGQIYAWDVVNEAFNDDGTLRHTIWYDTPGIGVSKALTLDGAGSAGTAYIEQALRWARAADPAALLFYNDYSAEAMNAKSDAIYKMVQDFKARGVPLDGVGLQMHLTAKPPSLDSMEANMKRLTDLGLQVQITELDVRLPVDASGAASAADLATEARIYRDVVAMCLRFKKCTAVQTWGFTDKYSWIPGQYHGLGAGLEFDAAYQPKPAYEALQGALAKGRVLVYTRNGKGYVHENIADSVAAIKKMGAENGFDVDSTDDWSVFTDAKLKPYKAIVFANSNNEAFEKDEQRDAFKRFIEAGGGFVGIHSASGSERNWPYFWEILGGKFVRHPKLQTFTVRVQDPNHPATRGLPATFQWEDECYFIGNLNPNIHPLLVTDPVKLDDSERTKYPWTLVGNALPLAWYMQEDGGREFYTALGHKKEAYANPILYQQILGGILWAMGEKN